MFKNPISIWLFWLIHNTFLEIKYFKKRIRLGYLTNVRKSIFEGNNVLYDGVRFWYSTLGKYSYIAKNAQISRTSIGKFCAIGPNVMMGLGTHPTSQFVSIHPAFYSTLKQSSVTFVSSNLFKEQSNIIIGNDVWIGANVLIADGVEIANGAIVAAGAVVTKNIGPYEIVGGVPAKLIKKRFTESQINFLQKFEWWNKDKTWLMKNSSAMKDIESFIALNS